MQSVYVGLPLSNADLYIYTRGMHTTLSAHTLKERRRIEEVFCAWKCR